MTGKRIFVILGFGIFVAGSLTALWLMTLPSRQQTSSYISNDERAEKERQVADAQRLAEQERQRLEVERKQRGEDEGRRLADAMRVLETERQRQAEIVQASVTHRETQELKIAEARKLAELERHRLEADLKEASRQQQQLEADRRLADAVRQLETERVRQAEVVQASMKQRLDTDRRQLGARDLVPANAKGTDTGVVAISAKPAGAKAAKYRTVSGNKVGRPGRCIKSCVAHSRHGRTTGPSHSRRHVPAAGENLAYLCPWRWLERVIAELTGPVRFAEVGGARRMS